MSKPEIAIATANLGGYIKTAADHTPQSVEYDYFNYTDDNFPPRPKAMHPRLWAKVPKMFNWQLNPGYEIYIWLDGSIEMIHEDAVKYLLDNLGQEDMLVFKHWEKPNIRQEARTIRKGLQQSAGHILRKYEGELTQQLYDYIASDQDYVDDALYLGGIFAYRSTAYVQAAMCDWWYYNTRFTLEDQISLPYVLKDKVKFNVLDDNLLSSPYFHVRNVGRRA